MRRFDWSKPYRRRSLYRRWRPWLFGWKSIFPVMLLVTVGQFYTEGAVTWPDSMMRSADGYVRSVFQELPSFGEKERKSAIARPYTELPKREPVEEVDESTPDIPYGAVEHRVKRIVDGDTVFMKDGTKVRLHGIDTPEGVNVNEAMVCNGSAWWYSRYARFASGLRKCQADAKEAGLGLWADDDPMPPWEWRRR